MIDATPLKQDLADHLLPAAVTSYVNPFAQRRKEHDPQRSASFSHSQ
jgi:hypothetical protein